MPNLMYWLLNSILLPNITRASWNVLLLFTCFCLSNFLSTLQCWNVLDYIGCWYVLFLSKPTLNLFIAAKQNCQSPWIWRFDHSNRCPLPAIDLIIESQTLWSFGDLNGEYLRKPITAIPRTSSFSSRLQHVPSPQHQWLNLRRTSCSKGSNGYLQGCICNIFWIVFLHVCVPLSISIHLNEMETEHPIFWYLLQCNRQCCNVSSMGID